MLCLTDKFLSQEMVKNNHKQICVRKRHKMFLPRWVRLGLRTKHSLPSLSSFPLPSSIWDHLTQSLHFMQDNLRCKRDCSDGVRPQSLYTHLRLWSSEQWLLTLTSPSSWWQQQPTWASRPGTHPWKQGCYGNASGVFLRDSTSGFVFSFVDFWLC